MNSRSKRSGRTTDSNGPRDVAEAGFDALVSQPSRVFKAGNSLAVRIPHGIAKHMDIEDGSAVELAADSDTIVIRKATSRALADLIDRITPENLHEPMFENPVGRERW
jgi:antitoxin component of MazEF toxin-antitoxin module